MSKRKAESEVEDTKEFKSDFGDKHTLDSDEEDYNSDEYVLSNLPVFTWNNPLIYHFRNVLNYDDIEGEEDGIERVDPEAEVKVLMAS